MIVKECHVATVSSNQDPQQRGRLLVICPTLLGDDETALPMWVEPCHDWGWFYVPDVGETIEIETTASTPDDEIFGQATIDQLNPRWRSVRHYGNEETDTPTPINEDFKKNYGKRRGFATPVGHVFMFDDTEGEESWTLKWQSKAGANTYLTVDKDGSLIAGTHTGHVIYMNSKDGELSVVDQHGNTYSSNEEGIKLINKDGSVFELKGQDIQAIAQKTLNLQAPSAVVESGKIHLGDSSVTEPLVLGAVLLQIFSTHTHPTAMGPSGPPTPNVPRPFSDMLSQKAFTK